MESPAMEMTVRCCVVEDVEEEWSVSVLGCVEEVEGAKS